MENGGKYIVFTRFEDMIIKVDKSRHMIYNKYMEKLYTLPEVATLLRVSRKTIYRYIESGKIKATKIGQWRIKQSDLDKLLK